MFQFVLGIMVGWFLANWYAQNDGDLGKMTRTAQGALQAVADAAGEAGGDGNGAKPRRTASAGRRTSRA